MARIGDRSEIEAFVRSVDRGGFSAAARELGVTPSALSKLVSRLEESLGVRLLARTTRHLRTTPEGESFLGHCRNILAEIEQAEAEVTDSRARPRGRIRVHSGVGFGNHQLVPALPRFCERYPEVEVELVMEDHPLELARAQIDVSVWPGLPADPAAVARKLCDVERVLCASPDYIARHGMPRTPGELVTHNCIRVTGLPTPLATWVIESSSGRQILETKGSVSSNNVEGVRRMALAGLGIARLNEFMVSDDLAQHRLRRIDIDAMTIDVVPLHVLFPASRDRLPRVRVMIEFLTAAFSVTPLRARGQAESP